MIGKIKLIFIFSILLIFACGEKKDSSFLSFSLNGQDGDTSYATAWEIRADGNIYLHGGSRSVNRGNYSGKLPEYRLKKIFDNFASLKLSNHKSFGSTDYRVGDYFEFQSNTGEKNAFSINGQYSELPNEIYSFLENCYKEIKHTKLAPYDSTYLFKTKAYLKHNTNLRQIEWEK